jgi:hypothetical protein
VILSRAFSFFAASRVREKEVSETEIWPRREGERGCPGGVDDRSRLRAVDCLRAVLKRVFYIY